MFDTIEQAAPDAILGLTEVFRADTHPDKINLTMGVYRDDQGHTPVLECIKQAQRTVVEKESTKSYLGIDGDPEYRELVPRLLLGESHAVIGDSRFATLQTPGGTGALKVAADLIRAKLAPASIWCSKPTWANHPNIFQRAGVNVETYGYLDSQGTDLDFDLMLDSIRKIPTGDIVCLHACCHNPTGVDPTADQWQEVAKVMQERQLLPLFDCAYQGFSNDLEQDVEAIRHFAAAGIEMLICSSFSKNFGLYGERVGALTIISSSPETTGKVLSQAKSCVRANYSNPPRHGAALVVEVLKTPNLMQQWQAEVAEMRKRIRDMRTALVEKLTGLGGDQDFTHVTRQNGMFSYSGLTPLQVDRLRKEHSIYIVGSGRINIAGITSHNIDQLVKAIGAVL